jgi:hypothetical protein
MPERAHLRARVQQESQCSLSFDMPVFQHDDVVGAAQRFAAV